MYQELARQVMKIDANLNSRNGGGVTFGGGSSSFSAITDYQKSHGIVMGVVVVLLFPFGAMFMRMGGSGIVHGILQVLSLCALLVGLGLGVKLANMRRMVRFPFSKRQFFGGGAGSSPGPGSGSGFGPGGGSFGGAIRAYQVSCLASEHSYISCPLLVLSTITGFHRISNTI